MLLDRSCKSITVILCQDRPYIASLEPVTLAGELDGAQAEMAFWCLRAQRRQVS
jgi:hypothetical protein